MAVSVNLRVEQTNRLATPQRKQGVASNPAAEINGRPEEELELLSTS